jgi:hypothetical protein
VHLNDKKKQKINEKIQNDTPSENSNKTVIQNKIDTEKEYVIFKNYFKNKKNPSSKTESIETKETAIATEAIGNDTISSRNESEKKSEKLLTTSIYEAQSIIDMPLPTEKDSFSEYSMFVDKIFRK